MDEKLNYGFKKIKVNVECMSLIPYEWTSLKGLICNSF